MDAVVPGHGGNVRPCEYFDMMGGSGPSGLACLLFAKFSLTVNEVIEYLENLSRRLDGVEQLTSNNKPADVEQADWDDCLRYRSPVERLEALRQLVMDYTWLDIIKANFDDWLDRVSFMSGDKFDFKLPPVETGVARAKAAVVSSESPGLNGGTSNGRQYNVPILHRTYECRYATPKYTFYATGLGTFGAPGVAKPGVIFSDFLATGRHTVHNPTRLLLEECSRLWPGLKIGTVISIGTGEFDPVPASWNFDVHPMSITTALVCSNICKENQRIATEIQKYVLPLDPMLRSAYYRFDLPVPIPFFEYGARAEILSETRGWMRSNAPSKKCRSAGSLIQADAFPIHNGYHVALSCLTSLFNSFNYLGYYEEARVVSDTIANMMVYEEASEEVHMHRMISIALDAERLSWLVRHGKPLSYSEELKSSMSELPIDGLVLNCLLALDTHHPALESKLLNELSRLSDIAAGAFYSVGICSKGDLESQNGEVFKTVSRQLLALAGMVPSSTEKIVEQMGLLMQITSLAALCEAGTKESLRGYKRILYNGSFVRHLHNTISTVNLETISVRILAPIVDAIAVSIQLKNWSFFRDDTITKLLSDRLPNSIHFWSFVNLAVVRIETGAKPSSLDDQSNSLHNSSKVLLACEKILSQASKFIKEKLLEVIVLSTKNGYSALLRKCLLDEQLEVFHGSSVPSPLASTLIDRTTDANGETLIHLAARHGFPEVLKSIAECLGMHAAQEVINRPNILGQTPLHLACIARAPLRFFDLCWKLQANVKVQCNFGRTPLHYCFPETEKLPEYYSGLMEVIESNGLPTNFPHRADDCAPNDKEKRMDSRAHDFQTIIIELLQHRAAINLQDHDGLMPVHLAAKRGWGQILGIIFDGFRGQQYQTIEADCLTLRDKDGLSILDYARMSNDHEGERIILNLLSARGMRTGELSPARQLKESWPLKSDKVLMQIGGEDGEQESYSKPLAEMNSTISMPLVQSLGKSFQGPLHDFSRSSSPSRSIREVSTSSDKSSVRPNALRRGSDVQSEIQSTNRLMSRSRSNPGRESDKSGSPKIETVSVSNPRSLSRSAQSNTSSHGPNIEDVDFVEELEVLGPDMVPAWSDLSNVNKLCKRCKLTLILLHDESELPIDDSESEKGSRSIWSESNGPTIGQLRATAHRGCHFCTLLLTRWIDARRNLRLGAEDVGCGWNRKFQDKLYENDKVHLRLATRTKGDGKYLSGGVRLWCAKGDRHESSLVDNVGFWKLSSRRRANASDEPGPDCMEYGHDLAKFNLSVVQGTQTTSSMWHPEKYGINPPIVQTATITVKNGRYVLAEGKNDADSMKQTAKHESVQGNWSQQKKIDVFDTAEDITKYWLNDCMTNHTCLDDIQDRQLPTRIINVENEPFLFQSNGGRGRYATLSYQWGQCKLLKTTSDTLKAHHNSIPMDQMPKTFTDVIKLTRALGLRYLWIDSLCILQDSEEDCQRELDSMPDIYANSSVTIAAVGSSTADSGCPLNRNKLAMIDLRISDNIVVKHDAQDQYYLLNKGSLHDRAWCYQEIEISPRLLTCGASELFWQCKKGKRRESDPMNLMLHQRPDLDLDDDESISDVFLPEWSPVARILDQAVIPNSEKGYRQWHSIFRKYAELRLTFPGDKLRALSAMAKRFATLVDGPLDPTNYVCGLWRADLQKGLLWTSQGGRESPRPRFRAPSWSWAAYDNRVVNYFMLQFNRPSETFCSEILDVSVEPVSYLNYFGPIKYGKLTIYGPLAGVPEEIYGTYDDDFARYNVTGIGLFAAQMAKPLKDKDSKLGNKPGPEISKEPDSYEVLADLDDSEESVHERLFQSRRSSRSTNDSERRGRRIDSSYSRDGSSSRLGRRSKSPQNPWFTERGLISWDIKVTAEPGHKVLRMTEEYGILLCPVQRPGCSGIFQRIGIMNVCSYEPKRKAKLRKRFDAFDWKPEVVTII